MAIDAGQAADALGPRIVVPEEAAAAELRGRHGDHALRIEVQTAPGGAARMLAVLDLDAEALADEADRLNRRDDAASLPIEVVGRATWLALRRLSHSGMIQLTGGSRRVLHVSPTFADPSGATDGPTARTDQWRDEASGRSRWRPCLRRAAFPRKRRRCSPRRFVTPIAARLCALGETTDPSLTQPDKLPRLVDSSGLSAEAERVLACLQPGSVLPTAADAAELARSTARLVTALSADQGSPAPEHSAVRESVEQFCVTGSTEATSSWSGLTSLDGATFVTLTGTFCDCPARSMVSSTVLPTPTWSSTAAKSDMV